MTKLMLSVCMLALLGMQSSAIMVVSGGHTNAPPDEGGWKTQVQWSVNPTAATIIGPHYVVSDEHDNRVVGSVFSYLGTNYTSVSNLLSPSGALRVYRTSTALPTNSWLPIYTNSAEIGKTAYVFGLGPPLGDMITTVVTLTITNFLHNNTGSQFDVSGSGNFKVLQSTNLLNWVQLSDTFAAPTNTSLASGGEKQLFYKLLATTPVLITNGWKPGVLDSQLRWGKVLIDRIDQTYGLVAMNFNPALGTNACANWSYDSSGGVFINESGVWKFAGAIHGSSSLNLYRTSAGEVLYGAMLDLQGLTLGYSSQAGFVPLLTYPITGVPIHTDFYITRVSVDAAWLVANFYGK